MKKCFVLLFIGLFFLFPKKALATNYYVATTGDDSNSGAQQQPFKTIQRGADVAQAGDTIKIFPGTYYESITPKYSGTATEKIIYQAVGGINTVHIRGTIKPSAESWIKEINSSILSKFPVAARNNLYKTNLTAYPTGDGEKPRFVILSDANGNITNLPNAREPDWGVTTEWKYLEHWWTANGGDSKPTCDPFSTGNASCDKANRSSTQIIDDSATVTNESRVDSGNLTSINGFSGGDLNLTGATIYVYGLDSNHYMYLRTVSNHDGNSGKITLNKAADSEGHSLGYGSKYYLENHPVLLDAPGEWYYDTTTKLLYLWPINNANLGDVEITYRSSGFNFAKRLSTGESNDTLYITLKNLNFEAYQGSIINAQEGRGATKGILLTGLKVLYGKIGINLFHGFNTDSPGNIIEDFTIENSEVAYTDATGWYQNQYWCPKPDPRGKKCYGANDGPDLYQSAAVKNIKIQNTEFHHLGFRQNANGVGLSFQNADGVQFIGNHLHHIPQNGMQFSYAGLKSTKNPLKSNFAGYDSSELIAGNILIRDNIFEKACLASADCGALKFWSYLNSESSVPGRNFSADDPEGQGLSGVWKNVLIYNNIFRNNYGWSYGMANKDSYWGDGTSKGMGGVGFYADRAAGFHLYRNLFYNNGFAGIMLYGAYRDGNMVVVNNTIVNSYTGIANHNEDWADKHEHVNTVVQNNIFSNLESNAVVWGEDPKQSGYTDCKTQHKPFQNVYNDPNFHSNYNLYFKAPYLANNQNVDLFSEGLWYISHYGYSLGSNGNVQSGCQYGDVFDAIPRLDTFKSRFTNSLFEDNSKGETDLSPISQVGFANYGAGSFIRNFVEQEKDDFKLAENSQAIDAGTGLPFSLQELLDSSHFNIKEIINNNFDIGAFEYTGVSGEDVTGDVNGDGVVDMVDIGIILKNYGVSPVTDAGMDLNNDNKVNIIDVAMVIKNCVL